MTPRSSADIVATAHGDLFRIAAVILAVELVVLTVFVRSVLAAVLVIVASLLVVLTALSVSDLVFADLGSLHGLTFYVPFAAAVLLLAFGSDYSIYVVGRIWARSDQLTLQEAIVDEGSKAASAVSAAGITLALTFALLAIINLASFREFALAMAAGILIDTFVVRTLLLPAMLALFGRFATWPSSRWTAHEAGRSAVR